MNTLFSSESWFSVTPEIIARRQALVCSCDVIIDAFSGCGGNSIQFAFACRFVISIDNNPERLSLLQSNAEVYGVGRLMNPIIGDVSRVLRCMFKPQSSNQTSDNISTIQLPSVKDVTPSNSDIEPSQLFADQNISQASPQSAQSENSNGAMSTSCSEKAKYRQALEHGIHISLEQESAPTKQHNLHRFDSSSSENVEISSSCNIASLKFGRPRPAKQPGLVKSEELNLPDRTFPTSCSSSIDNLHCSYSGRRSNSTGLLWNGQSIDVIFMSPPWGGPGYTGLVLPPGSSSWNTRKRHRWFTSEEASAAVDLALFNLDKIHVLPEALEAGRRLTNRLAVYLPRNTSIGQILQLGWTPEEHAAAENQHHTQQDNLSNTISPPEHLELLSEPENREGDVADLLARLQAELTVKRNQLATSQAPSSEADIQADMGTSIGVELSQDQEPSQIQRLERMQTASPSTCSPFSIEVSSSKPISPSPSVIQFTISDKQDAHSSSNSALLDFRLSNANDTSLNPNSESQMVNEHLDQHFSDHSPTTPLICPSSTLDPLSKAASLPTFNVLSQEEKQLNDSSDSSYPLGSCNTSSKDQLRTTGGLESTSLGYHHLDVALEEYFIRGRQMAITAYLGDFEYLHRNAI
ncbi:unnamed protein product [Protopolystoma xenopodis]|uniref:Trimethylguanosine synthase n=1 Tax=Protopolystoma xenopodis TaxID=117903 RepID=A0A448WE37_9PLAT|nr:unnamed protein product [Protopolystoma xenopodis]